MDFALAVKVAVDVDWVARVEVQNPPCCFDSIFVKFVPVVIAAVSVEMVVLFVHEILAGMVVVTRCRENV